jgi:hypothetical protein
MSVRFVHLLDAAKRNELMIIYTESLAGIPRDQWTDQAKGLVRRALARIVVTPLR